MKRQKALKIGDHVSITLPWLDGRLDGGLSVVHGTITKFSPGFIGPEDKVYVSVPGEGTYVRNYRDVTKIAAKSTKTKKPAKDLHKALNEIEQKISALNKQIKSLTRTLSKLRESKA